MKLLCMLVLFFAGFAVDGAYAQYDNPKMFAKQVDGQTSVTIIVTPTIGQNNNTSINNAIFNPISDFLEYNCGKNCEISIYFISRKGISMMNYSYIKRFVILLSIYFRRLNPNNMNGFVYKAYCLN